jgi:3-isopropylmalate dehydrogenase
MGERKKIAVIGGDGIGPEVMRAHLTSEQYRERGLPVELWQLDRETFLRDGTTMPKEIFIAIQRECAAVMLGALGDPRVPTMEHARDILFGMRFGLDLFANIRPVKCLSDRLVPLKGRTKKDVNFVVFRENTEGIYVGVGGQVRRGTPDEIAINEDVNTRKGVERIIRAAFEFARKTGRKRMHMADKSNAMRHAHELWLRVFDEVKREYQEITSTHVYIDALCLYVSGPISSTIVTNNPFGDIVTDLGAGLQGGLGMAASANVHPSATPGVGLFEPVHGSAPPLAGKNIANPFAALLTVGMMLTHLGYPEEEERIEQAVGKALEAGKCTKDVGGTLSTSEAGAAVRELLG